MSSEKTKNKLINSMKMTKAGTAKSTTASEKKEAAPVKTEKPKKAAAPKKTASTAASTGYTSTGFSSNDRRVWPD